MDPPPTPRGGPERRGHTAPNRPAPTGLPPTPRVGPMADAGRPRTGPPPPICRQRPGWARWRTQDVREQAHRHRSAANAQGGPVGRRRASGNRPTATDLPSTLRVGPNAAVPSRQTGPPPPSRRRRPRVGPNTAVAPRRTGPPPALEPERAPAPAPAETDDAGTPLTSPSLPTNHAPQHDQRPRGTPTRRQRDRTHRSIPRGVGGGSALTCPRRPGPGGVPIGRSRALRRKQRR
ncbi:MAG: hypothetical protein JWR30_2123 [Conexibacter sp.]|nr:hypothetical protein [Conexibacter sp.]